MMPWLILLYGLLAYAVGFAGLILFMLFVGDWSFAPWRMNGGEITRPDIAVAANVLLMVLFGVQHSVMARPRFKRAWTRLIPPAAERSTYVLASGLVLIAMSAWWRPLPGVLWKIDNQALAAVILGVQVCGWAIVVVASFTIDHWDLFGLRQVFFYFQAKSIAPLKFTERGLYKFVRHPIQTGILLGIWCTPLMTMTHLMFSTAMTAYMLIALRLEERDLVAELGPAYEDYRRRVPMLAPISLRRKP